MRISVLLSFLVAIIFAGGAVLGARAWLDAERREMLSGVFPEKEATPILETVVVATGGISFGEKLTSRKLKEIPWSGDIRPEGSFEKITDILIDNTESKARFALTSIAVGEPLLESKITQPGVRAKLSTALSPGLKAVSIRVNDVLGVAGFVLPGDRVDILLTRDDFVDVLLQGVKVLAIDQIADDRKDKPSVVRTVTFEVDTKEAQKLTLGAQVGVLSLALRNLSSDDVEENVRITKSDLSDFDAANDLAPQVPAVANDKNADRVNELEKQLRDLAAQVSRKAPPPAALPAATLLKPATPRPSNTKIGVIRNGNRKEYKVKHPQSEAADDQQVMIQPATAQLASWATLLGAQHLGTE